MSQEREGPYSDCKESSKKLNDNFFFCYEITKVILRYKSILPGGNFKYQYKTLTVNLKHWIWI